MIKVCLKKLKVVADTVKKRGYRPRSNDCVFRFVLSVKKVSANIKNGTHTKINVGNFGSH
jgi:hypothetical protein